MSGLSTRYWRVPAFGLALGFLALLLLTLLGTAAANGLVLALTVSTPLGMATAAIVVSGIARRYGLPLPFTIGLAALAAFCFAALNLALGAALPVSSASGTVTRAGSNPIWTGYALIGLLLFAVSATSLSTLASRREAGSREILFSQLLMALVALPVLNLVGAALWFRLRFAGRAEPVAPDEFLPPKKKDAK